MEVRRDALPQVRSCLGGSINTETDLASRKRLVG